MSTFTVAVVSAGLSEPSSTKLLADRLAQAVRRDGARRGLRIEMVDVPLRALARPIADAMVTGFAPAALQTALDAVQGADALIAVTPVFSASYSGLFKSFFDVADPQGFTGKPAVHPRQIRPIDEIPGRPTRSGRARSASLCPMPPTGYWMCCTPSRLSPTDPPPRPPLENPRLRTRPQPRGDLPRPRPPGARGRQAYGHPRRRH